MISVGSTAPLSPGTGIKDAPSASRRWMTTVSILALRIASISSSHARSSSPVGLRWLFIIQPWYWMKPPVISFRVAARVGATGFGRPYGVLPTVRFMPGSDKKIIASQPIDLVLVIFISHNLVQVAKNQVEPERCTNQDLLLRPQPKK